jgi:hypothetical protein
MGNVIGNGVNGKRFATGFPKTPKPAKCRVCNDPLADREWHRIGGKRYHKECR